MFDMPPSTLLWRANEIRIWATLAAALAAVVTFGAGYAQIRLQSEVSAAKDREFAQFRTASEERTAQALREAATANERAESLTNENLQLSIRLEQEKAERIKLEEKISSRSLTRDQIERMKQQ